MDRVITKSRSARLKSPAVIAAGVVALVTGGVVLANIDFKTQRVDRSKLSIETVQQGVMEIRVGANGRLVSRNVEQLAARVPGRVARADIKAGAVVQAGQTLVELENSQLVAGAEEAQSAWEGAVAELRAANAELEANLMNQEVALTQVRFNTEKARAKTEADEALAKNGLISDVELRRSKLDLSLLQETFRIEENRVRKVRDNIGAQLSVLRSREAQAARALDRARSQAADLRVKASIAGIVQAIDVQVGQQLQPGSAIGRIAQQDRLYAELRVPAREATQVKPGQEVVIDTRNGTVEGVVARVDPGVTDGTVIVDVDLRGQLPAGARPQLEVEGTVYVDRLPQATYVGKPAYVKNDATIALYKLDPTGDYATRTSVRTGKLSVRHMQVLSGLEPGDRIITSEVGEWQGQDRILLK